MAALVKKLVGLFSSKEAEAKALLESFTWARYVGLNLQIVESDTLMVVQTLKNHNSICNGLAFYFQLCLICCPFFQGLE